MCLPLFLLMSGKALSQQAAPYPGVAPGNHQPAPRMPPRRDALQPTKGNIVTWPGFTDRGAQGSRFFLQSTQAFEYQLRRNGNTIEVELTNATVHLRNSYRILDTTAFATPAKTARLQRRRRTLYFVIALKSGDANPVLSTEISDEGYHFLYIDFARVAPTGQSGHATQAVPQDSVSSQPASMSQRTSREPTVEIYEKPPGIR